MPLIGLVALRRPLIVAIQSSSQFINYEEYGRQGNGILGNQDVAIIASAMSVTIPRKGLILLTMNL